MSFILGNFQIIKCVLGFHSMTGRRRRSINIYICEHCDYTEYEVIR
jgi:hypothetical protein